MTIDISQLNQEKRAFLKVNPGLLESLEQAIPQQIQKVKTRRKKQHQGKSKIQRELADIDAKMRRVKQMGAELRSKYMLDPNLRKIQEDYNEKHIVDTGAKGLVCPVCGASDRGNKMNGKPWCLKCNSPLVPKNKLAKWKKMAKVKTARYSVKDEFKRRGLDF